MKLWRKTEERREQGQREEMGWRAWETPAGKMSGNGERRGGNSCSRRGGGCWWWWREGGRESWIKWWQFGMADTENEKWLRALSAHFLLPFVLPPNWFCLLLYLKWQNTWSERGRSTRNRASPSTTCTRHLTSIFHYFTFAWTASQITSALETRVKDINKTFVL